MGRAPAKKKDQKERATRTCEKCRKVLNESDIRLIGRSVNNLRSFWVCYGCGTKARYKGWRKDPQVKVS